MVPIWSSATIAGLPLEKFPGWNANLASELFTRTKGSGAEVIKKKGGAGFAVGLAIQEVIEAIALDRRRVLPVSSVQNGCYGIRDVACRVPTVVGPSGSRGDARNRAVAEGSAGPAQERPGAAADDRRGAGPHRKRQVMRPISRLREP